MQSVLVLGRQPALGLAELESLYGSDKVRPSGDHAAVVDVDPCLLAFDRLGGSVKFCKLLTTLDTTDWKQVERFLVQVSPDHSKAMPEGKMQLGLSTLGFSVSVEKVQALGLTLKKAIRKTGRSVRFIPNKELELNTAQVIYNHLTGQNGWELVLIRDDTQTIIAQTVKVQDIDAYTRRDRERPKRDARVGMLPPKLAQIMINLAVGVLPDEARQSICEIPPDEPIPAQHFTGVRLLDPFCGTGVILQEATLMGYDVYGTDKDARIVSYTDTNLMWLLKQPGCPITIPPEHENDSKWRYFKLEQGDATSHTWSPKPTVIASETYLGRPFTATPNPEVLAQTIADCNLITKKFLQNIHGQIDPGTRLCLAIPAWQLKSNQFKHLPLIDQIEDLGYNRVDLAHVSAEELLYYRPDQIVARELLVITRK